VRFLLEIATLIALGYWGFNTGQTPLTKILLSLGAPLLIGLLWSRFGSPGVATPLSGLSRLLVEIAILGLAVLGLAAADQRSLAITFAMIFIVSRLLMAMWRQ
jgi:hypothetical protein